MKGARRALGGVVLVLGLAPVYRLAHPRVAGDTYREAALRTAELDATLALWGTVVTLLVGALMARLVPAARIRDAARRAGRALLRPGPLPFAVAVAGLATLLALGVGLGLYQGHLTTVDEMASTVHARYLAAGRLGGRLPAPPSAWIFPNTLLVDAGWVSQYPPAHLAALALALKLGASALFGPLLAGATAGLLALALPRLLPERPGAARAGALLFALSPMVALLAGGALSHLTAGAFLALALYAGLRARDGAARWALLAGAAVGLAVASRPLQGLVLGALSTLGLWLALPGGGAKGPAWLGRRLAGATVGGLPVALALAWYDTRLFGAPLRLGYTAAYGPRHGLGFHTDPWGYPYGPAEALAFTSTDVLDVGIRLLETPIPVTVAVGAWLLAARRLPRGAGFLVAWATLPLLAHAAYWFHASRMAYEAAPAWLALAALAAGAALAAPGAGGEGGVAPGGAGGRWRTPLADATAWSAAAALAAGLLLGAPQRFLSQRWSEETLGRITPPAVEGMGPGGALVFVHASWDERTAALLQGEGGMRSDTVASVIRRNALCRVHAFAEARAAGVTGADLPALDMEQAPGRPPGVEPRDVPGTGLTLLVDVDTPMGPACRRQIEADRLGSLALAPLLAGGELPGLPGRDGILFARDMGPARNRAVLAAYPGRTPYLMVPPAPGETPRALPYAETVARLWGGAFTPTAPPAGTPPRPPGPGR